MKLQTKKKIAGFTMIELLIAMAVTIILLYATVLVFQNATTSNQIVVQSADMTDNLRAGLNLIQQDLQQAGAGIPVGGISIPFTPDGSGCATTAVINRPILAGNSAIPGAGTFPKCNNTIPAVEPGNSLGPALTAPDAASGTASNPDPSGITDEITVLYQDNTLKLDDLPVNDATKCPKGSVVLTGTTLVVTFDPACINLTTAGIAVQVGDLILLQNATAKTLVCVTGISLAANSLTFATGDPFGLNGRNNSDAGGTIKQLETTSTCGGANSCFPETLATRIWMISYYLDNLTSPPWVRLIRAVNFETQAPVGETLENLQFTYNFVDGITNPSNQPTIPAGNSESQIRSVNIYLAARSSYNLQRGGTSSYARNNLMTQVSLRSLAYVDRYF
ncbi:MAG TPA: prepilin-type N-terminal cleavage/methylation domain-containing protein [Verrucomicrobiae bacterium]|nr:prepilin-type N-terminal cleavage/methylation domain-containing protein [Verrucomicrobiae bacterium]